MGFASGRATCIHASTQLGRLHCGPPKFQTSTGIPFREIRERSKSPGRVERWRGGLSMVNYQIGLNVAILEVLIRSPECAASSSYSFS
jgi:hypothetical protein